MRNQRLPVDVPSIPAVFTPSHSVVPYETQLNQNLEWAMSEGSLFFEGRGKVQESFKRITKRLEELNIPYAVVGGMALLLHGYRRFTEDVNILVTREGLEQIHQSLDGLGYVRPFEKSKNLRDSETGVKIEFLVTGTYPGDGKPKEIAFPDPSTSAETLDGVRVICLPQLVSLKIASGMTGQGRTKDIGDVEALIKLMNLPESFSAELHPVVQSKFIEIWRGMHVTAKRYILLWRNKWLTAHAATIEDMLKALSNASAELAAMLADGVVLDTEGGTSDDYARLVTTDPVIAAKYGMQDEAEYWGLDDDESSNNMNVK